MPNNIDKENVKLSNGAKPQFNIGRGQMNFSPKTKPKNVKETLKRLYSYLSSKKIKLIIVFLLTVLSTALSLLGPYLIGKTIDKYIIPMKLNGLITMLAFMVFIYLLSIFSAWIQNYMMIGIAQETVKDLRRDLFYKLQSLPLSFFDSNPHGDIMSRLTNDVDNISNILNSSITSIFSSFITLVGTTAIMLYLSPIMTLITVVMVPLMFYVTKIITSHTRSYFDSQQSSLGQLNGFIEETISGQKVVKVFNREEKSKTNFEEYNNNLKKAAIKAQSYSGIIPPVMNFLNNITYALVAGAGGWLAAKNIITIGVIASFVNYSRQFSRPINELSNQVNMLQSALSGAERVFEIMDEKAETSDASSSINLKYPIGKVKFDDVNFGYKKNQPILKNINLDVKPGQTIALVGPTGAGKTTVVNLLTRFYDIDSGNIFVDGYDIRDLERNSLRSSLGIVLQDTYLFSESVRENIRYGRLNATDEEVENAAKLANAHQFITRLKNGYDTILTDDGGNLSQGQKQLLSIARAILANPAILILDEATSSVDTRTELHIQEAMLNLMKGRTSFVIAHRLSTIKGADMIVVINDGTIIEKGTHHELLDKKGFYYNMYNSQFKNEIA